MGMPLGELAARIQGTVLRGRDLTLHRLAPLDMARDGDLGFLPNVRHRKRLRACAASAVITDTSSAQECNLPTIVVADLITGWSRAGEHLPQVTRQNNARARPRQSYECVADTARTAPTAQLGAAVTIGDFSRLSPGCVIGDGVRIGSYCEIGPNTIIEAAANVGNRVVIGGNCTLGGDAFAYRRAAERWLKIPNFGSVEIGDDVHIGANVTIDRGVIGDTTIASGVKIDNQVHIAHGATVGAHTAIAAGSVVAGEVEIGAGCLIGGGVGIAEGIRIASGIHVCAMSAVTKSLTDVGARYAGVWPVLPSRKWWRRLARISALESLGELSRQRGDRVRGD